MLTGNDLIALGLRPSKHFPEILTRANAHGLAGAALAAYVVADVFHEGTAAAESLEVGRCQTTNCNAA